VIVIAFAPETSAMLEADHEVVPVAVPLVELAALAHLTEDTPTLSFAEPERATAPDEVEYVLALVGDDMATVGIVVSAGV
jgi:BarA-like signal transduction histidine kinase